MEIQLCDIGANLLDDMYQGFYNGKKCHQEDLHLVLERASMVGIKKMIITAGTLSESQEALEMSLKNETSEFSLYSTVGIHPTRCNEFLSDANLLEKLNILLSTGISQGKVVAIGECGLDYDRLNFCDKETQINGFIAQLSLIEKHGLPVFFHNRNTEGDFLRIVSENREKLRGGGVVHSFDGSMEEMQALVSLGFYIGINGCSLKTSENLSVVSSIPLTSLLIETDCPWCGIKASHASASLLTSLNPPNPQQNNPNKSSTKKEEKTQKRGEGRREKGEDTITPSTLTPSPTSTSTSIPLFKEEKGEEEKDQEEQTEKEENKLEKRDQEEPIPSFLPSSPPVDKSLLSSENTRKRERFEAGRLVKDRTEPAHLLQVLEVVSKLKGVSERELALITYQNSLNLFKFSNK